MTSDNSETETETTLQEFVLREAGINAVVINGQPATVFFFTLHDTTPEKNMLVHEQDGKKIPIVVQSYPIPKSTATQPKKEIVLPNRGGPRLIH